MIARVRDSLYVAACLHATSPALIRRKACRMIPGVAHRRQFKHLSEQEISGRGSPVKRGVASGVASQSLTRTSSGRCVIR